MLFQNVIMNRFITAAIPGVANTSQYVNATGDEDAEGIEYSATTDAMRLFKSKSDSFFWNLLAQAVTLSQVELTQWIDAATHLIYHAMFTDTPFRLGARQK